MKNKVTIPTILFIIVLVFSFYAFSKEDKKEQSVEPVQEETLVENQIILFYGMGCPHCAIVEEYLEKNKVEEKIDFSQKEVYFNRANSQELEEKAKSCGIPADSIGVPFLWDGEKCLVGDVDIVEFFKERLEK